MIRQLVITKKKLSDVITVDDICYSFLRLVEEPGVKPTIRLDQVGEEYDDCDTCLDSETRCLHATYCAEITCDAGVAYVDLDFTDTGGGTFEFVSSDGSVVLHKRDLYWTVQYGSPGAAPCGMTYTTSDYTLDDGFCPPDLIALTMPDGTDITITLGACS